MSVSGVLAMLVFAAGPSAVTPNPIVRPEDYGLDPPEDERRRLAADAKRARRRAKRIALL